ncbi:hypothetical protein SAMN03159463_02780 [Mesorhizobium sp. NFR06]|uniref:hypothetical protein n=1 Tax=Mesorhizobium sp. NFR06 TaxID=1566290 RepID=UPI0008EEA578|nr:hypothetical protein [Mesorhizobium sp. NFR06]SFO71191.1 hypothetical protein SAMN03159463_02780 [Mesorhizobium sp. NFR06]
MPGADRSILITGARAPVALHLARLFHGAGHRVVLADTPARPIAATSKACARYHRLPPPRFARQDYAGTVEALIRAEGIDLVIPTCEEVFYLALAWRGGAMPAKVFAPAIELLAEVHNKHAFIRLAERLGLEVPETALLNSRDDIEAIRNRSRVLVFKPAWSRFASHVLLRPPPQALDFVTPSPATPWVAQHFVDGEEISAYAVAREGRIKGLALYRSLYRAGTGAGIFFERVEDDAARELVERIVAGTSWTGQISFDLMREPSGRVLPLECNPRAVSGLHFFRDPARFVDAVLGEGPEVAPDVTAPQTVRLAMWIYGLPAALRSGGLAQFRKAMHESQELLDWPGDSAPVRAQWPALAEIAGVAWRERISLQAASTRDIEWNGPD